MADLFSPTTGLHPHRSQIITKGILFFASGISISFPVSFRRSYTHAKNNLEASAIRFAFYCFGNSVPTISPFLAPSNLERTLTTIFYQGVCITFVHMTLRGWRANEGGTTDLPDYSETVPRDRTLFEN